MENYFENDTKILLFFYLDCLNFIEIYKKGKIMEAIEFAKENLKDFSMKTKIYFYNEKFEIVEHTLEVFNLIFKLI